jgi:hypothetical protein
MYRWKGTKDIMGHGDRGFCIVLLLFQVIVIIDALAINKETRLFPSFPMTAYPLLLSSLSLASFAVHPYHPLPPVPSPHSIHLSARNLITANAGLTLEISFIFRHTSAFCYPYFFQKGGERKGDHSLSTTFVAFFGHVATGVAYYNRIGLSFFQCVGRSGWGSEGEWGEEGEEESEVEESCHF